MARVFARSVSDDVHVEAEIGYGRTVTLRLNPAAMEFSVDLEPDQAREIGLALMDAATAVERATCKPAR